MNKWLLLFLLLSPSVVRAELVTPQFTQGSMNSTTTTQQDIEEDITITTYGSALNKWSGDNITHTSTSSGGIADSDSIFNMTTAGSDFSLEIITRAASQVLEVTEIERTIETTATTTSLSVFSQQEYQLMQNQKSKTLPTLWQQQQEMLPIRLCNSKIMELQVAKSMEPTVPVTVQR